MIVGGGPTGVELAGALAELANFSLARDFRSIDTSCAQVIIVEAGPRILGAFPEDLQQRAEAALERLGPGRALGVGDRLELDVAGAHGAGIDAALVLTGGATEKQAALADPAPRHVASSLGALVFEA